MISATIYEDGSKDYKELFTEYLSLIKRDGINKLADWIKSDKSDFFTAPASVKYHSNIKGGLCMHTVKVFERLKRKLPELREHYGELSDEAILEKIAIAALFHDLCKINFYVEDTKNVKNKETGAWEKVPYYTYDDKMPLGHEAKSLFITQSFIKVHEDEAAAILAHMGNVEKNQAVSQMFEKYPLAIMTHVADIEATYLDETIYKP